MNDPHVGRIYPEYFTNNVGANCNNCGWSTDFPFYFCRTYTLCSKCNELFELMEQLGE